MGYKFKTHKELLAAAKEARASARKEALDCAAPGVLAFARGTDILLMVNGERVSEQFGVGNITKKDLTGIVDYWVNDPFYVKPEDKVEICFDIGFDLSESPHNYFVNGDYDPGVAWGEVVIWERN